MIYLIGMSHVINVLKALSPQALEVSHENLATVSTDQDFIDLALHDSVKLGASAKAFVIAPRCGWGQVAVLNTSPEGEKGGFKSEVQHSDS
jgi:hypothetical protein